MKKLLTTLITGLLISISIIPAQAGEMLMEGETVPYTGYIFKREELDKFQFVKDERLLIEEEYEKRLALTRQPRSPLKAALFSLVLPGTGQIFVSEETAKGQVMLGTEIALMAGALYFGYRADSQLSDYANSGSKSDYNAASESRDIRNLFFYGMAGLGVYSAVDAYLGANRYNEKLKAGSKRSSLYIDMGGERVALGYRLRF